MCAQRHEICHGACEVRQSSARPCTSSVDELHSEPDTIRLALQPYHAADVPCCAHGYA